MPNSKNSTPETGEELQLEDGASSAAEGQSAAATGAAETPKADGAGTGNGNQGGGTPPPEKPKGNTGDKKMGLVTFIQLTEPNKYVVAMLKNKNSMEAHTKAEWQQIVKDLLDHKVS